MADDQKKSEIRWWLRCIIVPLGIVGIFIVWLGCRTPQQRAKTSQVVVLTDAALGRSVRVFREDCGQSVNNQNWCNFRLRGETTGTIYSRELPPVRLEELLACSFRLLRF